MILILILPIDINDFQHQNDILFDIMCYYEDITLLQHNFATI